MKSKETSFRTISLPRIFPFLQQDIESENVNVVKRLFKIQNINASTIRTVMVAHCRRHDNPDLVLDYEAQSQARRQKGQQQQPLLFDLGTSGSEEEDEQEEDEDCQSGARSYGLPTPRVPQPTMSGLEHVLQVTCSRHKNPFGILFTFLANFILHLTSFFYASPSQSRKHVGQKELEIETQVAQMMGRAYTKAPDPSLIEPTESGEEDKTYLLFTTGSLTYSPHQIGNKPNRS